MATHIAIADGNLTAAATWGVVDATALLDDQTANTALTTSYVESAAFTPGAITIDGIAVKVASRAASPTGTMSVRLAQAGATVAGTEVTINVSDLEVNAESPSSTVCGVGWTLFKFGAPVVLLAATPYTVSAKTSSSAQVNLFRNATAGNWARMLRTTTTGAPGAADNMFVLGEWTAAATKTNRVVTMDQTAATDYGGGSTTLASLGIGKGGTLAYATTAATNFLLRLSGILEVWPGGTLTLGSTTTQIPRDSTAILEFDCAADGDFGLVAWGSCELQGLSRTSGKNQIRCKMTADAAGGANSLTVDTDTGWLNGDEIAISTTSRTGTEAESHTLNGAAGASTLTLTGTLAAAKAGSVANKTQAKVILLSRNVQVRAVTSTLMTYVRVHKPGSFNADWTEFRYLGTTTTGKRGLEVSATTGAFAFDFCVIRDCEGQALTFDSAATISPVLTDCSFFNCGNGGSTRHTVDLGTASGAATITRCTVIFDHSQSGCAGFLAPATPDTSVATFLDVWASSGVGSGIRLGATSGPGMVIERGDFHGLGTSSASGGIYIPSNFKTSVRLIDTIVWRCNTTAPLGGLSYQSTSPSGELYLEGCTFFGNGGCNLGFVGNPELLRAVNCSFSGDTSFSTPGGIHFQASAMVFRMRFEGCSFGVVAGIHTAHTSADFSGTVFSANIAEFTFVNTNLASSTEFAAAITAGMLGRSFIARQRKDGATNTHETLYQNIGTVSYDAAEFRTAAPSEKLAPSAATASVKLRTGRKRLAVQTGDRPTFSCYVKKNGSYNGNQPRLILAANPAVGTTLDEVLATMSGGAGSYEQLSGQISTVASEDGVLEVYVDCDGTAGQINVDDWAAA
jgi:hypothetical protein